MEQSCPPAVIALQMLEKSPPRWRGRRRRGGGDAARLPPLQKGGGDILNAAIAAWPKEQPALPQSLRLAHSLYGGGSTRSLNKPRRRREFDPRPPSKMKSAAEEDCEAIAVRGDSSCEDSDFEDDFVLAVDTDNLIKFLVTKATLPYEEEAASSDTGGSSPSCGPGCATGSTSANSASVHSTSSASEGNVAIQPGGGGSLLRVGPRPFEATAPPGLPPKDPRRPPALAGPPPQAQTLKSARGNPRLPKLEHGPDRRVPLSAR